MEGIQPDESRRDHQYVSRLLSSTITEVSSAYHSWKRASTRQLLDSLARPHVSLLERSIYDVSIHPVNLNDVETYIGSDSSNPTEHEPHATVVGDGTFILYEFEDGCTPRSVTLSPEPDIIIDDFAPCKPYESCAPALQNIFIGDDSSDMPFLPLADDDSFDWNAYLEEYTSFSWQRENDPDCEHDYWM